MSMQVRDLMRVTKAAGRTCFLAFSLTLLTTVLVSTASAGCGSYDPHQPMQSGSDSATVQTPFEEQSDSGHGYGGNSIVGMWKITFTATDGSGYADFGYTQFHSDGTEILNSGARAPSTQNFCLGVWQKTGASTYKLNHFALSYDASTGILNGKVVLLEKLLLAPGGYKYSGTFVIDVYDPTGVTVVLHFEGKIAATRVTVNTLTP